MKLPSAKSKKCPVLNRCGYKFNFLAPKWGQPSPSHLKSQKRAYCLFINPCFWNKCSISIFERVFLTKDHSRTFSTMYWVMMVPQKPEIVRYVDFYLLLPLINFEADCLKTCNAVLWRFELDNYVNFSTGCNWVACLESSEISVQAMTWSVAPDWAREYLTWNKLTKGEKQLWIRFVRRKIDCDFYSSQ